MLFHLQNLSKEAADSSAYFIGFMLMALLENEAAFLNLLLHNNFAVFM
jgi:hypothetical protein